LRITNVNWVLEDGSLLERLSNNLVITGINGNGYANITGYVKVKKLNRLDRERYVSIWPELEIDHEELVEQYEVVFKNPDEGETEGKVWQKQYIAEGNTARMPTIIPTKKATDKYTFTFKYWAREGTNEQFSFDTQITERIVLVAVYEEVIRKYTIVYKDAYGEVIGNFVD
jgi:hypothetical protein